MSGDPSGPRCLRHPSGDEIRLHEHPIGSIFSQFSISSPSVSNTLFSEPQLPTSASTSIDTTTTHYNKSIPVVTGSAVKHTSNIINSPSKHPTFDNPAASIFTKFNQSSDPSSPNVTSPRNAGDHPFVSRSHSSPQSADTGLTSYEELELYLQQAQVRYLAV